MCTSPGRGPTPLPLLEIYGDADVFALASEYESFGMAAAEAAAAGTASVVTDRCGIADLLRDDAALVVPFDQAGGLRGGRETPRGSRTSRAGSARRARAVPARWSWAHVAELQEELYRRGTRLADLAVVGQDPGFAGGVLAQTEALCDAAVVARPRAGAALSALPPARRGSPAAPASTDAASDPSSRASRSRTSSALPL